MTRFAPLVVAAVLAVDGDRSSCTAASAVATGVAIGAPRRILPFALAGLSVGVRAQGTPAAAPLPALTLLAIAGLSELAAAADLGTCSKVVYCLNGMAHSGPDYNSPTGNRCNVECGGHCCTGWGACSGSTRFAVCADEGDGSCNGSYACLDVGGDDGTVGLISGGSCSGTEACYRLGYGGEIGDITESCVTAYACQFAAYNGAIGDVAGSCNGDRACQHAANEGTIGTISNGSCAGGYACYYAGRDGGAVGDINGSCQGYYACNGLGRQNGAFQASIESCCNNDYECRDVKCLHSSCPDPSPSLPATCPVDQFHAPSDAHSDAPSSAPPQYQVVCGKGIGCAEGNERPASAAEVHAVRCCADTDAQGWKKQDHCDVWASSLSPNCPETSFTEAMQLCEDEGARLCTKTELGNKCSIKTGCNFDSQLIWSSSPGDPAQSVIDPTQQYHVVCGKGTGCVEGNDKSAAATEEHPVRCCSDTEVQGWKKQGNCDVWSSSLTPDCHKLSLVAADQLCGYAGARLCTKTELAEKCTIKTGCGYDGQLVWSGTVVV